MAKFLRPHRGTAGVTREHDILLKAGEIFLEVPSDDVMIGRSPGRIIVGDGQHRYSDLYYATTSSSDFQPFITDPSLYKPLFINSECATSDWEYRSAIEDITNIGDGSQDHAKAIPVIVENVKRALVKHEDSLHNHEIRISSISPEVETLTEQVARLREDVDSHTESINSLNTKVNTNTNNISILQSSVSDLNSTVSSISNKVDTVGNQVNTLNTTVSDYIVPTLNNITVSVGNLRSDINRNATSISNLATNCATTFSNLNTKLNNTTASVSTLNSTVSSISDKVDYNGQQIGITQSDLSGLSRDYNQNKPYWNNNITTVSNLITTYVPYIHSPLGRTPRCKDLGIIQNSSQMSAFISAHKIKEGEFQDIEIGDTVYIHADRYSARYWIAGIDTFYKQKITGSPDRVKNTYNTHHIVLFPIDNIVKDSYGGSYQYLDITVSPSTGYNGSNMRTDYLVNIGSTIKSTIGDNYLVPRYVYNGSGINTTGDSRAGNNTHGYTSSGSMTLVYAELPTEVELIGYPTYSSSYKDNIGTQLLPLFQVLPLHWWLGYYNGVDDTSFWTRSFSHYAAGSTPEYKFVIYNNTYSLIYADQLESYYATRPIICIGDIS